MRFFSAALLAAVLLGCAMALNFNGPADLCSMSANKCFPAYVWNMDSPTSGNEQMFRIEINIDPLASYNLEVIIRRINRTNPAGPDSLMQFQAPFDAQIGSPYDCCIHEALGILATIYPIPAVVNQTFSLARKDGFQTLYIRGVYTNMTETELRSRILDTTSQSASWDDVNAKCPVSCAVQTNYVFVQDGSGSISDTQFSMLTNFLVALTDRLVISENAANVGYVYFGQRDDNDDNYFCVVAPGMSNTNGFNLWQQALGDPDWYTNLHWPDNQYSSEIQDDNMACWHAQYSFSCLNGECEATATVFLYITPNATLVKQTLQNINNQRANSNLYRSGTPTGLGILLGIEQFERAAVYRPTIPEIIIILTDGVYNVGYDALGSAQLARDFGIITYGIGINLKSGDQSAVAQLAGSPDRYFAVVNYNVSSFEVILEPLLAATCLGESGTGAICPNCPSTSFCSTCSQCITCIQDSNCNKCQSCNLATRQCTDLPITSTCPFNAPTQCDKWICDSVTGCTLTRDVSSEQNYQLDCSNRGGTWNSTICFCNVPVDPTSSGDDSNGVIVGTTVGAIGAAGAATLATVVGGVALCGLLACLALLALLALAIVAAVLLLGLLVLAVIGGIGIAALVMGIKMAIPPAIKGIEVAGAADITAMENPLSKGTEWVGSKVSGD
jgi:hypothetical protein